MKRSDGGLGFNSCRYCLITAVITVTAVTTMADWASGTRERAQSGRAYAARPANGWGVTWRLHGGYMSVTSNGQPMDGVACAALTESARARGARGRRGERAHRQRAVSGSTSMPVE